jgi:hypothetical protein
MPKLTYDSTRGLIQEAGSGVTLNADVITFSTLPSSAVQEVTATSAVTSGGVYTMSSSAALTLTVPPPSALPGATLIFRSVSAHAHKITGSADAGPNIFAGHPGATPANSGQRITFPATVGTSVSLISDGLSYCVSATSGTLTITDP